MTRRQAIQKILDFLESQEPLTPELEKATILLRDFLTAMPGKIWDDQRIRQAIERHISVFHRTPTCKELDSIPELPSHPIIQNRYKMTAGEWLYKNYPPEEYGSKSKGPSYSKKYPDLQELLDIFKREYQRIQPISYHKYNEERDLNTPSWQYIAKRAGVKTWNELKTLCGISLKKPRKGELELRIVPHVPAPQLADTNKKKSKPTKNASKKNISTSEDPSKYVMFTRRISMKESD